MSYQIKYNGPPTTKFPLIKEFWGIYELSVNYINVNSSVYINKQKIHKTVYMNICGKHLNLELLPDHGENLVLVLNLRYCADNPIYSISTQISPHNQRVFQYIGPLALQMKSNEFIFHFPENLGDEYLEVEYTLTEIKLIEKWEYTTNSTHSYTRCIETLEDLKQILYGVETTIKDDKMTIKNITSNPIIFNQTFRWYCQISKLLPQKEQTIKLLKPDIYLQNNVKDIRPGDFVDLGTHLFPTEIGFDIYNFHSSNHVEAQNIFNNPIINMVIYSDETPHNKTVIQTAITF